MASYPRIPARILNAAKTKFRRELRAFEALARSVDEDADVDYQLETDIRIKIATDVKEAQIPLSWSLSVSVELRADGLLYLTGLLSSREVDSANGAASASLKFSNHPPFFSSRYCNTMKATACGYPQFYPTQTFTTYKRIHDPYIVLEVDTGFQSLQHWIYKAHTYLENTRVGRVIIVKHFPLRQRTLASGIWKRAAVTLVLGRVENSEDRGDICTMTKR